MVRGMHVGYNQTSCPPGGQPTYWKTITSQEFSRSRVLNLTAGSPTWRVWYQEEEPPEHVVLKPMGLEHRSSSGLGETDYSWRVHTRSWVHWDPRQKHWPQGSLGQTYLLVLESLLEGWGGCGSLWGQWRWQQRSWVTIISLSFPGGSGAGTPWAKQPTRQKHSLTQQQTACPKTLWDSLLEMPLDLARPAHQTAKMLLHPPVGGTGHSHQEAHTSL